MADKPDRRPLLDVAGAAAYLGVGERFIRRIVAERRIAWVKVGKFVRFDPDVLDAYIAANTVDPID